MNYPGVEVTHFGIASSDVYDRIAGDIGGSSETAHGHLATLATIGSQELISISPGRGIVPKDEYGITTTYRRLGEAADYVMQHATRSADRLGAAVIAAELYNTALYVGEGAAVKGLNGALGIADLSQHDSIAAAIASRYDLSPTDDDASLSARISTLARSAWSYQCALQ